MRCRRNRSGTGILRRCTCGGRDGRWLLAGQCCSHYCCRTQCDEHCPPSFKEEARRRLPQIAGCRPDATDEGLRKALLRFIADFANWDMAANQTYLEVSRALVKAAHGEEPPLVVDPFAGGGSIPLEALRLGCETFASDLNPVACLILKVMLEDIPRHGPGLAEALRKVGGEIKRESRAGIGGPLSPGPGRCYADCLSLGAHGTL